MDSDLTGSPGIRNIVKAFKIFIQINGRIAILRFKINLHHFIVYHIHRSVRIIRRRNISTAAATASTCSATASATTAG